MSSCEAEYIAATIAACQGIWLTRLLSDISGEEEKDFVLKIDNKSTISLTKNPVLHDRSNHIDIRYHFIRSCVASGKIRVDFVSTQEQISDMLTKSLGHSKFQELCLKIGVIPLNSKQKK